jgi:hypothetical protein
LRSPITFVSTSTLIQQGRRYLETPSEKFGGIYDFSWYVSTYGSYGIILANTILRDIGYQTLRSDYCLSTSLENYELERCIPNRDNLR